MEEVSPKVLARQKAAAKRKQAAMRVAPKEVLLPEAISVANLAQLLVVPIAKLQRQTKSLLGLEFDVSSDYVLNAEIASLVAAEVAPRVHITIPGSLTDADALPPPITRTPDEYTSLPLRPPVVTIMGHVDHGKTTLLDTLRKSAVAASEAGGITQHIGAFVVAMRGGEEKITFLDTPGHAAFETMRARGANVTDIVVLVVAADDGVMPQTREAIKHAQAAGVPMIVAVNKIDKPGIDKQKIKNQLLDYDVQVEELGGDTICVEISALKGTGLQDLEEAILTLAELQDLRADPSAARMEGVTLESQVQKGRGATSTVLVKDGTLRPGDVIVAGTSWCKVRALVSDQGKPIKEAPPATPVEVVGWKEVPPAGERVVQVESEDAAKRAVVAKERVLERARSAEAIEAINKTRMAAAEKAAIEAAAASRGRGGKKGGVQYQPKDDLGAGQTVVSLIVKADVSGSVEAVADAVAKVSHPELRISVVARGVGHVTESDIERAWAATTAAVAGSHQHQKSIGFVVGFNVKSDKKAAALAKRHGVQVLTNNVIYRLMDSLKAEMGKLLPPDIVVEEVGEATVAAVFDLNAKAGEVGKVAGCKVSSGSLHKANKVKVMRKGKEVWQGPLKVIKHFKREVMEIAKGNECGLAFDGFDDFQEGDVVVSLKSTEKARTLD
ncbi:hypothetical protein BCR44DRAFT_125461 [Catenaria anguillulae PL171]|uniref:Translation initiation factor IF-2, chloroplastic n=1 Tax=Catenaria anguillulae PL171 TaxID=765915 RepID=A0A1Y2HUQ2_9FUNG|nr:hypothetical protein BCR44DRAFT_125461 [Catenaria anguillulae PL171]